MDLGGGGKRAVEELVHRVAPEHEPALEVLLAQATGLAVEFEVDAEGAASVGLSAEQDRLPELGNHGDVSLEVELGDVREDPADLLVHHGLAIEGANELLAVGGALDVGASFGGDPRMMTPAHRPRNPREEEVQRPRSGQEN